MPNKIQSSVQLFICTTRCQYIQYNCSKWTLTSIHLSAQWDMLIAEEQNKGSQSNKREFSILNPNPQHLFTVIPLFSAWQENKTVDNQFHTYQNMQYYSYCISALKPLKQHGVWSMVTSFICQFQQIHASKRLIPSEYWYCLFIGIMVSLFSFL